MTRTSAEGDVYLGPVKLGRLLEDKDENRRSFREVECVARTSDLHTGCKGLNIVGCFCCLVSIAYAGTGNEAKY